MRVITNKTLLSFLVQTFEVVVFQVLCLYSTILLMHMCFVDGCVHCWRVAETEWGPSLTTDIMR